MQFRTSLIKASALASALVLVSSCASSTSNHYPQAADLQTEVKPQLSAAAATSENLYEKWNRDVEAWGDRGWATVARLCRWAVTNGDKLPFTCPKPPPDS